MNIYLVLRRPRLFHIFSKMEQLPQRKCEWRRSHKDSNYGEGERIFSRHPSHLKGKEIGLYYARLRRERQNDSGDVSRRNKRHVKSENENPTSKVHMDVQKERHVEDLLLHMRNTKLPSRRYSLETEDMDLTRACSSNSVVNQSVLKSNRLKVNTFLDEQYKDKLESKMNDEVYKEMLKFRKKLPAYSMREDILDLIESNQVVVITGETGCGKTTQVTQFILDYYIMNGEGSTCKIVCTQPRRISAIAVAERVAQERGEKCGNDNSVGYQIRLEHKLPRETGSILYCTTGIMLQRLRSDPDLLQISHLVLDEIHERTLESDFLLIIMKDLLPKRPNLKLILMSATMNAEMFSEYFNNCPMLNIPGFTYPVEEYMLEDVLEMTRYTPKQQPNKIIDSKWKRYTKKGREQIRKYEEMQENILKSLMGNYSAHTVKALSNYDEDGIDFDLIVELIKYICRSQGEGAILIFLPGWDQISKLHTFITNDYFFNSSQYLIIPLHSLMPTVNQKEVFNQPPLGVRKIIISTNIAETSITIDDVVFVIDSGKIKMNNFDTENNIATLKPEWIARANALQRRGRAGRVQPGICYHLFTKWRESQLKDYPLPEILRIRLEELCLKIKLLELGDITAFVSKAIQLPHMKTLQSSIELLKQLNAFDDNENLTSLGYHLAKLPLDPHTGKMILFGAMFSCLDPILTVAVSLNFKDAFIIPLGKEQLADSKKKELAADTQSDHLMLVRAFRGWENAVTTRQEYQFCRQYFLSASTLRMLNNMKKQFARYLHELHFLHCDYLKHPDFNINSNNDALIKAIICAGLYPNVAKLKFPKERRQNHHAPPKMYTPENGRIAFHPKSVNYREKTFKTPWLVYHKKVQSTEIFLHDATIINPYPLLFFGGKISIGKKDSYETVTVDNHIVFHCPEKIAKLVIELRQELDKLLAQKIAQPGVTNWNKHDAECELLKTIIDLITQEETCDFSNDM
ncbi:ATP-dependent DNA/RNA helicase DHX36-like [Centruroides vittatus]|uniref:ATP-dependent DNA/RNA helicase DHX36-like n=1 Tax=Centruroides vittatus TaxID=120091 RepID=UPI00350F793F